MTKSVYTVMRELCENSPLSLMLTGAMLILTAYFPYIMWIWPLGTLLTLACMTLSNKVQYRFCGSTYFDIVDLISIPILWYVYVLVYVLSGIAMLVMTCWNNTFDFIADKIYEIAKKNCSSQS